MPVVITELVDSGSFNRATGEKKYAIVGADTEDKARQAGAAELPAVIGGYYFTDAKYQPVGGGVWFLTATYSSILAAIADAQADTSPETPGNPPSPEAPQEPEPDEALYPGWSFDIMGETQHITTSLRTWGMVAKTNRRLWSPNGITGLDAEEGTTTGTYSDTGTFAVSDCEQAINVDRDGKVGGCDIGPQGAIISTTRRIPAISLRYIRTLGEMRLRTNVAKFWNFNRGELQFHGASGSRKGLDGWDVTFRFGFSANRTVKFKAAGWSAFPVWGHHYLWSTFGEAQDTGSNRMKQVPEYAYVEQVFKEGNFRLLGLT